MGTHALPDIYTPTLRPAALWQARLYQAKYLCPWYNHYMYFLSYTMATRDLLDVYAQARGRRHEYQANPSWP